MRPRHSSLLVFLLCAFATALPARAAHAQNSADLAQADAAFNEALKLMDAGNFAEACPKLEQSQRLAPASGTLLNLGDCYEQLGRLPNAFLNFNKAAALSHAANKPERERVARQRADALRGRIALLTVIAPNIPGLAIAVDGVPIPSSEWAAPYPIEPGTHALDASAPGREPFRVTLSSAAPNATLTVEIPELRVLPANALRGPEPEPLPTSSAFDGQGIAALVSAGIGVTGVVAGTVFGLESMSKHDESDRYCSGDTCRDVRGVTAMEDARAAGDRATLSFIVGGVGLGAGAVLWFARPFGPRERTTLSVALSPSALRVTGSW